jgi:hypothetical protein
VYAGWVSLAHGFAIASMGGVIVAMA